MKFDEVESFMSKPKKYRVYSEVCKYPYYVTFSAL